MRAHISIAVLVFALAAPAARAETDSPPGAGADKTLSPYFFIDGGDPAVDQLPLERTSVDVAIAGVMADVTVTQVYKNDGRRPINARYVFPASTRAAVHGLKMTVGDKVVEAKIKRREEARADFEQAKREGKSASLLEQDRPNVFSMNVANIMPKDRIVVELRYTELLVPTDATYELVYPTVVGPRYSNEPEASAPDSDKWIKSPYQHQGEAPTYGFDMQVHLAAGLPVDELASPSHAVKAVWAQDHTKVDVSLDPSEKSGGNRDFILRYRLAGAAIQTGLLLFENGDEKFFLLLAQPPARVTPEQIPPRDYVFIVDVSGSMHGFPLSTAKELVADLIGHLRPIDTFNVLEFSGDSQLLAPRSLPATPENIKLAIQLLDRENGSGGTELLPALTRALTLPKADGASRSFVVVTDGYIGADKEALAVVRQHLGDANVFAFGIGTSVNRYLIEGLARAGLGEPFMVADAAHAREAAAKFRAYIQSPVLTGVKLSAEGFDVYDVEPASIPDLFATRPLVIHGKWRGAHAGTLKVTGHAGAGPYTAAFDVSKTASQPENRALPYLWARTRIAGLSDYSFDAVDDAAKEQIVELGLKYNLLTKYTSFIAVLHVVRNTAEPASDVAQPLPIPEGVTDNALPMAQGDEPELIVLVAGLALVALGLWARRRRAGLERVS